MTGVNQWGNAAHARRYLAEAHRVPHVEEAQGLLADLVPPAARRILDVGTGDGRLLARLLAGRPDAEGLALDFSPTMLAAARARFADDPRVRVIEHNLEAPLPEIGPLDAIVSSFAIHHCEDERKRTLYGEIFERLAPGGVFWNLEHVAWSTPALHERFLRALGRTAADEDPSNRLAPVDAQLAWLRRIGFQDVDCHWKWLELALFGGLKPRRA